MSYGGNQLQPNSLYYGDCLDWMRKWDADCVDLIYLDPPFNSNANYSILFGTKGAGKAQYQAFKDTWYWDKAAAVRYNGFRDAVGRPAHKAIVGLWHMLGESGMLAYLTYMAERLEEMQRILKPTGSIYLHCDPTASHYLKTVMDAVFENRIRNEIIWAYTGPGSPKMRQFNRKHDVIFWYSNSDSWVFNVDDVRIPHKQLNTNRAGAMIGDALTPEMRDKYLQRGKVPETWWPDFSPVGRLKNERLGYPTQKPLSLLERIIKASSNEGDIVLDPFCGCGTAMEAADRLKRKWAGVDISSFAIDMIRERRMQDLTIPVHGIPADFVSAQKMAKETPFEFEAWAVNRLSGFIPNTKQVADGGVDGRATLYDQPDNWESKLALAQVKGGRFNISSLRDFIGVVERDKAAIGRFITLETVTSPSARANAAALGDILVRGQAYPRLSLWSIEEFFNDRPCPLPPMADPYTGRLMKQTLF